MVMTIPESTEYFVRDVPNSNTDSLERCLEVGPLDGARGIIIGPPGSGKSSLIENIGMTSTPLNYISVGEISRALDPDSPQRKTIDELFAGGKPSGEPSFFIDLVRPMIEDAVANGRGFILDGIPKKDTEIGPLMEFLKSINALPNIVLSCEASSDTLTSRVMNREGRAGDPDTLEIFLNRIKAYERAQDGFKGAFRASGAVVMALDTEKFSVDTLSQSLQFLVLSKCPEHIKNVNPSTAPELIAESIKSGSMIDAMRIYGKLFDDILPQLDHGVLATTKDSDFKQAVIEQAFAIAQPELRDTPHFLSRLASNYIETTLTSIAHLADSLYSELDLRGEEGNATSLENIKKIFNQQFGLKLLIEDIQKKIVDGVNSKKLLLDEVMANRAEGAIIEKVFRGLANTAGEDLENVTFKELMGLQLKLWGQITSNRTLFSPDYNYRALSNGLPQSHHSLLPFSKSARAFAANSMGNYLPFVEAVSAGEGEFSSTFGFIHFIGMNKKGEAFGVEYPIMMHDQRLLDLKSPTIVDFLRTVDAFYSNHDLWHNLLPVFANSFILHHPDAPLSYGGRLPAYENFGRALRAEKEEYEIMVAMAHAITQAERFKQDPDYEMTEMSMIVRSLQSLRRLPDELAETCDSKSISIIVDYLACYAATKAYNIFPDGHAIYEQIQTEFDALNIEHSEISAVEVATLLAEQGLLDVGEVTGTLEKMKKEPAFAQELLASAISVNRPGRESGSEYIVDALRKWGVLDKLSRYPTVFITPLQKTRWAAITGPQRRQLKGHMEKVHGKKGVVFGEELVDDPRTLVLRQKRVIDNDKPEYHYRTWARKQNQRLGYAIYSLLFDDGQLVSSAGRHELSALRSSEDIGERLSTRELVKHLDTMLHSIVKNDYSVPQNVFEDIQAYAIGMPDKSKLKTVLHKILRRFTKLSLAEQEHQIKLGITYQEAARRLIGETMEIA